MATLTLTIPAAKATRILAAYGNKAACLAEIQKVLADKVQSFETAAANAAVVQPVRLDTADITGDIS